MFAASVLIGPLNAQELQGIPADIEALIQKAGNTDSDEVRLVCLKQLRDHPTIDEALKSDVDELIAQIDRWIHEDNLRYFTREVKKTRDFNFRIAHNSPVYALSYLYRGRMLTWYTLEAVWSNMERRQEYLAKAREFFECYSQAFPENKIARMYLGQPIPPGKLYVAVPGAPDWALYQREGLERLTDIIEWWIDNRMQENGAFGGGWNDDCEMWRWWTPVLIGFDSPKITRAQARFSEAVMSQPHMRLGYTTKMFDVEHTAEDSADAITPMMHLDPDNDVWSARALRLAELMESLWTGRNERGFLQFKSTYFTAVEVDPDPQRACDTVRHPKVVEPTLLYWQRTGDERLTKLFSTWMDTWVDATARTERGKPAGVIPSAIHWPDGMVGGLGPDWWDPRNHDEHTLYRWPGGMHSLVHTLLLAHHLTGQAKYLDPIRSTAALRLEYLKSPPSEGADIIAQRARKLGSVTSVCAKYALLTGSHEFDELLTTEPSPYVRYRVSGDFHLLTSALKDNAAALRVNFAGYTGEVRYTDRVLSFPDLFGWKGMFRRRVAAIRKPNRWLLYSTVTGDPGYLEFFPVNAVRWLTPPRDIAALVTDSGVRSFSAKLFHFGNHKRPMSAELYLLSPGRYTLTIAATDAEKRTLLATHEFAVSGRRSRVSFELPPKKLCVLEIQRR